MEEEFLQTSDKPIIKLRHRFFKTKNEECRDRIIVMVPGFLDNIDNRMPLVEAFQEIASVIMYEPRGYGNSSAPRKRRKYKVKHFVEDFAKLISHYELEDQKYCVWGSCVGSAIAFQYHLDHEGPKPSAVIAASPDTKFKTQWWFDVVNLLPYPIVWVVYKFVIFVLKRYLRKKNPNDVKNIDYSVNRFKQLDLFVQMRILVELIHRYDIRGRETALDVPILVLSPKKDWFVEPENSRKMAEYHPKSQFISLGDAHRMIVDTEEAIVKYTNEFISTL